MLGVYTAGISGAHLNPAVTLANCVYRKFPWKKFPGYIFAQTLGAFVASGIVYANYKSAIDVYEGGPNIRTVPGYSSTASGGIFCTYPAPFMTRTGQFFSEFIASTILMFCIYALKDNGNLGAGNLTPLCLFFVIFGIGACFGWETGYAINFARDFGPRLMSYFLGYGHEVWAAGNYYFWVSRLTLEQIVMSDADTDNKMYVADTDGLSLLRLSLWRLSLRHVPFYGREPHQHTMDWPETSYPTRGGTEANV